MKRLCVLFFVLLLSSGLSEARTGVRSVEPQKNFSGMTIQGAVKKNRRDSKYLPDRVIVKLKSQLTMAKSQHSFGIQSLDAIVNRYSVQSISPMFPGHVPASKSGEIDLTNFYVITYSAPIDAFDVADEVSKNDAVEYAEPRFYYTVDATLCSPNDSMFSIQWGLKKILADSAWCIDTGDTNVIIAVIDQGVQWDHPDLAANIWINPGEYGGGKESNGIDDDGNGLIDDWHGWDFGGADYNNPVPDNNPAPTASNNFHGTEVSGVASAVTNNNRGIAGVGYNSKILAIKTSSDNDTRAGGLAYIVYWLEGTVYAADMGATVINCSFGGSGASSAEQDIINYATQKGSLVVAAAGNIGTQEKIYPASYDHVISTVATGVSDIKASYSSFGTTADVCAPGDGIYTTAMSSSYTTNSGTSFSAPHVAGLVALVKSMFPSYSGLQLGEQVRVTSDTSVYSVIQNITFKNLLGKGRINAYRALTDTVTPSLRMTSFEIRDSATGLEVLPLPNQTVNLNINVTNYLHSTTSAVMTLSVFSVLDTGYARIINGIYPIGAVSTLQNTSNSSSPFVIHFNNLLVTNRIIRFILRINDGNYSDFQIFEILYNPTYATHNNNNIQVTLTNNGRIGFNDFPGNTQGNGFLYGGGNQLYEGGLMIGYSSTKLVNVVRNPDGIQDGDFVSSGLYTLNSDSIAPQVGSAVFTDSGASLTNRIGLRINMHSYAFTTSGDSDYVILQYTLGNISGSTISNVYIGLFFDWDMLGPQLDYFSYNRTAFDAARGMGYAWNTDPGALVYCGVRALDTASGYMGLINSLSIDLSRAGKWSWLSGGVVTVPDTSDIHFAISSGPYSLANGTHRNVAFALVGGKGLADLQTHADAAQSKWNLMKPLVGVHEAHTGIPATYALHQNYPNPFNPVTRISYDVPKSTQVSLKIFDILGREVATLVNSMQAAGKYEASFDASRLASGIYFYRLSAGEYTSVKKMILMR